MLQATPCRGRRAQYPMNQTTIAGKSSFPNLLHGKKQGEAKIDPQLVDVTHQLKRKHTSRKTLRTMYSACLLQL